MHFLLAFYSKHASVLISSENVTVSNPEEVWEPCGSYLECTKLLWSFSSSRSRYLNQIWDSLLMKHI